MAMGRRGQDEARRAIASCRPFGNSTGSFRGTEGSTRSLGYLYNHPNADQIRNLLRRATYVVWSYQTPIGCVTEDETGNITKVYFEAQHSATTSNHQTILRIAFSDFETIGERPRPVRRPRLLRSGGGADRANQVVREYTDTDIRQFQDLRTTGPDFIAPDETAQQNTLKRLLDPRYADPNWTPYRDGDRGSNLPEGADRRDAERVEREGPWRP